MTLNIYITTDLEKKILAAVKAGAYTSADEMVNEALQSVLGGDEDEQRLLEAGWSWAELEAALLEGARSPAEPVTADTWNSIRQQLDERRQARAPDSSV